MSDSLAKIAPAIVQAQSKMGNALKDAKNPFFKSTYANLDAVREAVLPAFNAEGISILQPTVFHEGKKFVQTTLLHTSGEFYSSLTEILSVKELDAQGQGSGISYARRYGLQSLTNCGQDDDDGNQASGKQSVRSQTPAPVSQVVTGNGNIQVTTSDSRQLVSKLEQLPVAKPSGDKSFRKAKPAVQEEL